MAQQLSGVEEEKPEEEDEMKEEEAKSEKTVMRKRQRSELEQMAHLSKVKASFVSWAKGVHQSTQIGAPLCQILLVEMKFM